MRFVSSKRNGGVFCTDGSDRVIISLVLGCGRRIGAQDVDFMAIG